MALNDNSPMPFGKHKDTKMCNVPASYLLWLYENTNRKDLDREVAHYIEDNIDGLKQEVGRK